MNLVSDVFSKFRNGRRESFSYRCLIRVIKMQLDDVAKTSGATGDSLKDIIEDLENVAASRAIKKHKYFEKLPPWSKLTKGCHTKIRYDILSVLKKITKGNTDAMDFLMSIELAELCSECHLDTQNGDIKDFWKKIEDEVNELSNSKVD